MDDQKWRLDDLSDFRVLRHGEGPVALYVTCLMTHPDGEPYIAIDGPGPWIMTKTAGDFEALWPTVKVGNWTLAELQEAFDRLSLGEPSPRA